MSDIRKRKLTLRRGRTSDIAGQPTRLSPKRFTRGLDEGELAFGNDEGRVFIGTDPSRDLATSGRTAHPYQNNEIIGENSTEAFKTSHGSRMREGTKSDYYHAPMFTTESDNPNSGPVELVPFSIPVEDGDGYAEFGEYSDGAGEGDGGDGDGDGGSTDEPISYTETMVFSAGEGTTDDPYRKVMVYDPAKNKMLTMAYVDGESSIQMEFRDAQGEYQASYAIPLVSEYGDIWEERSSFTPRAFLDNGSVVGIRRYLHLGGPTAVFATLGIFTQEGEIPVPSNVIKSAQRSGSTVSFNGGLVEFTGVSTLTSEYRLLRLGIQSEYVYYGAVFEVTAIGNNPVVYGHTDYMGSSLQYCFMIADELGNVISEADMDTVSPYDYGFGVGAVTFFSGTSEKGYFIVEDMSWVGMIVPSESIATQIREDGNNDIGQPNALIYRADQDQLLVFTLGGVKLLSDDGVTESIPVYGEDFSPNTGTVNNNRMVGDSLVFAGTWAVMEINLDADHDSFGVYSHSYGLINFPLFEYADSGDNRIITGVDGVNNRTAVLGVDNTLVFVEDFVFPEASSGSGPEEGELPQGFYFGGEDENSAIMVHTKALNGRPLLVTIDTGWNGNLTVYDADTMEMLFHTTDVDFISVFERKDGTLWGVTSYNAGAMNFDEDGVFRVNEFYDNTIYVGQSAYSSYVVYDYDDDAVFVMYSRNYVDSVDDVYDFFAKFSLVTGDLIWQQYYTDPLGNSMRISIEIGDSHVIKGRYFGFTATDFPCFNVVDLQTGDMVYQSELPASTHYLYSDWLWDSASMSFYHTNTDQYTFWVSNDDRTLWDAAQELDYFFRAGDFAGQEVLRFTVRNNGGVWSHSLSGTPPVDLSSRPAPPDGMVKVHDGYLYISSNGYIRAFDISEPDMRFAGEWYLGSMYWGVMRMSIDAQNNKMVFQLGTHQGELSEGGFSPIRETHIDFRGNIWYMPYLNAEYVFTPMYELDLLGRAALVEQEWRTVCINGDPMTPWEIPTMNQVNLFVTYGVYDRQGVRIRTGEQQLQYVYNPFAVLGEVPSDTVPPFADEYEMLRNPNPAVEGTLRSTEAFTQIKFRYKLIENSDQPYLRLQYLNLTGEPLMLQWQSSRPDFPQIDRPLRGAMGGLIRVSANGVGDHIQPEPAVPQGFMFFHRMMGDSPFIDNAVVEDASDGIHFGLDPMFALDAETRDRVIAHHRQIMVDAFSLERRTADDPTPEEAEQARYDDDYGWLNGVATDYFEWDDELQEDVLLTSDQYVDWFWDYVAMYNNLSEFKDGFRDFPREEWAITILALQYHMSYQLSNIPDKEFYVNGDFRDLELVDQGVPSNVLSVSLVEANQVTAPLRTDFDEEGDGDLNFETAFANVTFRGRALPWFMRTSSDMSPMEALRSVGYSNPDGVVWENGSEVDARSFGVPPYWDYVFAKAHYYDMCMPRTMASYLGDQQSQQYADLFALTYDTYTPRSIYGGAKTPILAASESRFSFDASRADNPTMSGALIGGELQYFPADVNGTVDATNIVSFSQQPWPSQVEVSTYDVRSMELLGTRVLPSISVMQIGAWYEWDAANLTSETADPRKQWVTPDGESWRRLHGYANYVQDYQFYDGLYDDREYTLFPHKSVDAVMIVREVGSNPNQETPEVVLRDWVWRYTLRIKRSDPFIPQYSEDTLEYGGRRYMSVLSGRYLGKEFGGAHGSGSNWEKVTGEEWTWVAYCYHDLPRSVVLSVDFSANWEDTGEGYGIYENMIVEKSPFPVENPYPDDEWYTHIRYPSIEIVAEHFSGRRVVVSEENSFNWSLQEYTKCYWEAPQFTDTEVGGDLRITADVMGLPDYEEIGAVSISSPIGSIDGEFGRGIQFMGTTTYAPEIGSTDVTFYVDLRYYPDALGVYEGEYTVVPEDAWSRLRIVDAATGQVVETFWSRDANVDSVEDAYGDDDYDCTSWSFSVDRHIYEIGKEYILLFDTTRSAGGDDGVYPSRIGENVGGGTPPPEPEDFSGNPLFTAGRASTGYSDYFHTGVGDNSAVSIGSMIESTFQNGLVVHSYLTTGRDTQSWYIEGVLSIHGNHPETAWSRIRIIHANTGSAIYDGSFWSHYYDSSEDITTWALATIEMHCVEGEDYYLVIDWSEDHGGEPPAEEFSTENVVVVSAGERPLSVYTQRGAINIDDEWVLGEISSNNVLSNGDKLTTIYSQQGESYLPKSLRVRITGSGERYSWERMLVVDMNGDIMFSANNDDAGSFSNPLDGVAVWNFEVPASDDVFEANADFYVVFDGGYDMREVTPPETVGGDPVTLTFTAGTLSQSGYVDIGYGDADNYNIGTISDLGRVDARSTVGVFTVYKLGSSNTWTGYLGIAHQVSIDNLYECIEVYEGETHLRTFMFSAASKSGTEFFTYFQWSGINQILVDGREYKLIFYYKE